jgi:hypothetical protein
MIAVFLDIDGCLRHEDFFKNNILEQTADHTDGLLKFDKRSMKNLNHIIQKTGAKVVISSSWRFGWQLEELQRLFNYNGFCGEIIGTTPIYLESYTHQISRGKEISDWLNKNPVENYCIIDDCNDMLEEQISHFVFVDDKHGITEEDAEKAIQILST